MGKPIVTISREFGSGGRLIGAVLAERLNVPYYDKSILDDIAKEKGFSAEMMAEDEMRAKNSFLYSLTNAFGTTGYGPDNLSINERFFMAQFDYITNIAKSGEGGVIIGRCADYVLRDFKDATNVFVYAEEDVKIDRVVNEYGIKDDNMRKTLADVDKARANYYRYHTGRRWGEPVNYHLCIDSGYLKIDDIAGLVMDYMEMRKNMTD